MCQEISHIQIDIQRLAHIKLNYYHSLIFMDYPIKRFTSATSIQKAGFAVMMSLAAFNIDFGSRPQHGMSKCIAIT